jgi:hypothetical protein
MTENTKPEFKDILNLIAELPDYPAFETTQTEPMAFLSEWLNHHSRILDTSKGFQVNRCAMYWTGYDHADGFDGQKFVDSCKDSKGGLRQLAEILDTDLQIFELDPTNTAQPSLEALTMATSYGMMGVEENTQLFSTCSFGQGVETASVEAVNSLTEFQDLESFITDNCGLDHAAMLGASIACIMKGIPMILEGQSGRLVKSLLERTSGKSLPNMISCDDLNIPMNHDLPGYKILTSAICIKTLYAASIKTDCGKVKVAA